MGSHLLHDVNRDKLPSSIGAKAASLRLLRRKGYRTPATFVIPWDVQARFQSGDPTVVDSLRSELEEKLDDAGHYAVRSSADVEDSADYSFAGQFSSVLDVSGMDDVLSAILRIWKSSETEEVQTYLKHTRGADQTPRMAVIVQEMVNALVSGVAFSRNPVTGMNETIVEAVRGSGEALVQDGVTPERWVQKWGAWLSEPQESDIPRALIEQVVAETRKVARSFGRPVDLEWVWDGQNLYWVQLREITSLDIPVYSNRISKEVFPGLIKPLVWSVNVPLINGAWVRLFTELVGPNDLDPLELARSFYYRAYFNMSALGDVFELLGMPRETLELLLGLDIEGPEKPSFRPSPKTFRMIPRLLYFALDKLRFDRHMDPFLASMQDKFQSMAAADISGYDEHDLLASIDRLYGLAQEAAYFSVVPPILMLVYDRLLRMQLRRAGIDDDSVDLRRDMDALEKFEPSVHIAQLRRQFEGLDPEVQERIRAASYEEFQSIEEAVSLRQDLHRFLDLFGHLSDSGNDFSSIPWRERPEVILRLVNSQDASETQRIERSPSSKPDFSGARGVLLRLLLRRTRRFLWYREAVSSLYTFGYGLLRPHFLALGQRLVQRGLLEQADDIFYLTLDEVRATVEDVSVDTGVRTISERRRAEMDSVRDVVPPHIIYGDEEVPLEPDTAGTLKGVPSSRGQYTGPARVIRGLDDFDRLVTGDVLVIPYSDVGWTPLFATAAAVIAESGGLLSHSSIVAREYGIPAVVSVPGACALEDGTIVTVDGYRGQITVRDTVPAAHPAPP